MKKPASRRSGAPTVHKFGGASLGDAGGLRNALSIVEAGPRSAVVVVSAFAGVTDALLSLVREFSRGNDTAVRRTARVLARRYVSAARAVTSGSREREPLLKRVRDAFAELAALTDAPLMLRELSPRAVDRL